MPSQILHTIFGEDLASGICLRLKPEFGAAANKALEKILGVHKNAFALGCQGPDIFYHSQGRRPVGLEYGALLHRRGIGTFTARLLKLGLPKIPCEKKDLDALGVYALGFMSHAILDRQAHPFIVYKSGGLSPSKPGTVSYASLHAFFERIIDILMLKILRGVEVSGWDQEGLLARSCEKPPAGLKKLLAEALVFAYPERALKDEKLKHRIENTLRDCTGFYRITAPASSAGKKLEAAFHRESLAYLYPENLPSGIDFLNLENRTWYYPAGEKREDTKSFPEIYENAVKTAADSLSGIIFRYLEEGVFPAKEAACAIGDGGLSIVDENGKPCAPNRANPLPLNEVLDQQAALRGL